VGKAVFFVFNGMIEAIFLLLGFQTIEKLETW